MTAYESFVTAKSLIGFNEQDAANLLALAPVFAKHGRGITDTFYAVLGQNPVTARIVEGRVEHLKVTHARWMGELFGGSYDEAYFQNRLKIGLAHVKFGIDPLYVEVVCSIPRTSGYEAIRQEVDDPERLTALFGSYCKIIDLDMLLINLVYNEERLDRLSALNRIGEEVVGEGQRHSEGRVVTCIHRPGARSLT